MIDAVRALWWREIVKFVRDRSRIVGALGQPLAFWVLLGFGFQGTFTLPGADAGVPYLTYLFPGIVALILLFTAIFSTISVVEERQSGFLQAALVAPQPRLALVLGIVLGGTTLAVGQAALFVLLAPLAGLAPGAAGGAVALLAATLTAVAFTALGVLLAWRLRTTRGFHAVMNLFLLPLWLLSGAFFPAEGAPLALRVLMQANPAYYGVAALRHGLHGLAETPGTEVSLGLALAVAAAFAALLLAAAAWTVRQPLFGKQG